MAGTRQGSRINEHPPKDQFTAAELPQQARIHWVSWTVLYVEHTPRDFGIVFSFAQKHDEFVQPTHHDEDFHRCFLPWRSGVLFIHPMVIGDGIEK